MIQDLLKLFFETNIYAQNDLFKKITKYNFKTYKFNNIQLFVDGKYLMKLNNHNFTILNKLPYNIKIENLDTINYEKRFENYNLIRDQLQLYIKTKSSDKIIVKQTDDVINEEYLNWLNN